MRRFVTIFPICENTHLIKDVGQLPFSMHREFGYDSTVVSYPISNEYTHLEGDGEVKGLKMELLKDEGKKFFLEKAVLNYIRKNAKNIDVLNLYHYAKDSIAYGLEYKRHNPGGFLFLKTDAYNKMWKQKIQWSRKWHKNMVLKRNEQKLHKAVDLISLESMEGVRLFTDLYPFLKQKALYLPNGVNDRFLNNHFPATKTFAEKENILLTVGRIGLKVKNNEMLLNTIPLLDLKDWKVVFVGPVAEEFQSRIDKFYNKNPELVEKVIFTGEINDRAELYSYYDSAKVFCLTSPMESFGISLIEAGWFGNYLLGTTGMSSFSDISGDGKFGEAVEVNDIPSFANKIQAVIDGKNNIEKHCEGMKNHIGTHFTWSKIAAILEEAIQKRVLKVN